MYEKLREYIEESNNIVFFGGAGVSTESGIPDFRSKDGLYNQHDVQFDKYEPEYLLSRECLYNNPKVFYEFYRQKMDTRNIEPNITHKVLAKMEEMGKLSAIVTQNIDGLHQKAGSKNVFEIHGTTQKNKDYIKNLEASQMKESVDAFSVGDTVKVYNRIKEGNKERIQLFEGTVIKRQGGSNRETFTVRKISNGVGVEKTWPMHSPNVEKVEVILMTLREHPSVTEGSLVARVIGGNAL